MCIRDRNDSTGLSFSKEVRLMSVSAADKAMPDNSYKPYQAYLYYGEDVYKRQATRRRDANP